MKSHRSVRFVGQMVWVAMFSAILLVASGDAQVSDRLVLDEDNVRLLVANSDFIFWGTVTKAVFECSVMGPHYYLSVEVNDEVLGGLGQGTRELFVGGIPAPTRCAGPSDSFNPSEFDLGREYLFCATREYDRASDSFSQKLIVSNGSVLCAREARSSVDFCSSLVEMDVSGLLSLIQKFVDEFSPEELYGVADVVLDADRVVLKKSATSDRRVLTGSRVAVVSVRQVLKGEVESNSVEFTVDVKDRMNRVPLIDEESGAIVFLKKTEAGYVLLGNERGYYRLDDGGARSSRDFVPRYHLIEGKLRKQV